MTTKETIETIFVFAGETIADAYKRRGLKGSKIDRYMRGTILEKIYPEPYPGILATVELAFTRKWGPLGLHTAQIVDVKTTMDV